MVSRLTAIACNYYFGKSSRYWAGTFFLAQGIEKPLKTVQQDVWLLGVHVSDRRDDSALTKPLASWHPQQHFLLFCLYLEHKVNHH